MDRKEFKAAALTLVATVSRLELRYQCPHHPGEGCVLQRILGERYEAPFRALFDCEPSVLTYYADGYASGDASPENAARDKEFLISAINALPD